VTFNDVMRVVVYNWMRLAMAVNTAWRRSLFLSMLKTYGRTQKAIWRKATI